MTWFETYLYHQYGSKKTMLIDWYRIPDGIDAYKDSHGVNYNYMRDQLKDMGDVMGFDNPKAKIEKRADVTIDDCIGL